MALGFASTLRNDILQKVIDHIDTGTAGHLKIYSGSRPATGGSTTTLLADFTLASPCAGSPSGGVLTFSAISNVNASASGTATWARITDSAGTFVMDLSVSTSGSDINLSSTALVSGVPVQITSATITQGNA